MATPFTTSIGSASISGSEFSLVNASTSLAASTTAGELEVLLDLSTMVAGDQYQIRVVDKVNGGTAANVFIAFATGVQSGLYRIPPQRVNEGWDVRVKLITGSARTVAWSLKQDVGDVNALTIANGAIAAATFAAGAITSTVLAAGAITAAKFATDAIDANALAAGAVTEIQSGLALAATALSNVQWTNARATLQDNLDVAVSTRASSAALATVQADTDDIQTRLPAALVSGRMSSDVGTWLGTAPATPTVPGIPKVEDATLQARLTTTRATNLDSLDAAVSTRAPASTAVSSADLTPTRAAKLDQLDAAVTSRAAAATALSTVQWTNTRATLQDNLDVLVSSRATAADVTGAIATSVATIAGAAAAAVWATVTEGSETALQTLRLIAARLLSKATVRDGDGTYSFRDAADTKDRLVMNRTGTARTVTTRDGT